MKKITTDDKTIVLASIALIALFAVGKGLGTLLEALHLKKGGDETKDDTKIDQYAASHWSPLYWRQKSPNTKLINDPTISGFFYDLARQIWESDGRIYDDPAATVAAFKKLNSKLSISVLASDFEYKYNQDLLTFLKGFLDTPAQKKFLIDILQYTDQLPDKIPGQ